MSKEGDSRRSTTTVQIWDHLFNLLENEYDEMRPKPVNFTAFINGILELYIKRKNVLNRKFPHLSLILAETQVGLFIKDNKLDQVAEIEISTEYENKLKCKLDKSSECEHVQFTLLSPALMKLLSDSFLSNREREKVAGTSENHGKTHSFIIT